MIVIKKAGQKSKALPNSVYCNKCVKRIHVFSKLFSEILDRATGNFLK